MDLVVGFAVVVDVSVVDLDDPAERGASHL